MVRQSKKYVSLTLIVAASALAVLLPAASAQAGDRHSKHNRYTVYAKVIKAKPIYTQVVLQEPVKECWTEQERYVIHEGNSYGRNNAQHRGNNNSHRTGNAVVGGVIGGVVGNQVGRNGNRGVQIGATIAGAIIGSAIANEAGGRRSNRRHGHYNNDYSNQGHYNNHSLNQGHYNNHSSNHGQYNNHASQYSPTYGTRPVQRCKTVVKNRYDKRIDGYNVVYVHQGRRYQTRTRNHPGSHIELKVNGKTGRYR